jgi:pimeloyl-ACP methyl ester carboxylesterase
VLAETAFAESVVTVSGDPRVELFVAELPGPGDCAVHDEPALLVIHGGPDWDHTYLRDPLVRLAGTRRVVMFDIRGCGRSTIGLPPAEYTHDAVVRDMAALLDALGLPRADLLGFSYGGAIAQRFTFAHPDRVRRLIVASSRVLPPAAGEFDGWAERDQRIAGKQAALDAIAESSLSGGAVARAWAETGAAVDVWQSSRLPGYLKRLAGVRFTGSWLERWQSGTLPPALPERSAERLAALGLPVLLLHGEQDMGFPAAAIRRAAAAIPSAKAVMLPDAGHMAHVDQPGRWLAALQGFLGDGPLE